MGPCNGIQRAKILLIYTFIEFFSSDCKKKVVFVDTAGKLLTGYVEIKC